MVQDLATQWIHLIRPKRSLHMRRRKVCQNSWSRRTDRKLKIQTTRWNLGKHVRIHHGITALQHLIDPAERAVRRVKKKVLQQYCYNQDEKWWSDSAECFCSQRNVQDLLADGKTPYERRFGEQFKGPTIPFGTMVENNPISPRDQARTHQFGKKVLPGIFLRYELVAGRNLERRYSDSRPGRFGKVGCIKYVSSKYQHERSTDQKNYEFISHL